MISVAAVVAAADAGLAQTDGEDFGVVVGAALGNLSESAQFLERVFTKGPSLANPMLFPNLVLNAPASQVAMALGWRGANLTIGAGEIAGEAALDTALGLVRRGRARAVVVAAGEELSAVLFQALKDLGALSPRHGGRERSAPFDRDANGPVLGEGAAAIVVENAESARRRRAKTYAVVERVDQFALPTANPHRWPAAASKVWPPLVRSTADLVFSGADSSPERDPLELALAAELAPPGRAVYSLAGAVGSQGGQGLSTIVAAVLALSSGQLPPIVGLDHPRADEPFQFPRSLLEGEWSRALVVGVARGGGGAAIELARGDVSTR
jgi:3-oxoacyl-[acyl-carrier-protein] synthase II